MKRIHLVLAAMLFLPGRHVAMPVAAEDSVLKQPAPANQPVKPVDLLREVLDELPLVPSFQGRAHLLSHVVPSLFIAGESDLALAALRRFPVESDDWCARYDALRLAVNSLIELERFAEAREVGKQFPSPADVAFAELSIAKHYLDRGEKAAARLCLNSVHLNLSDLGPPERAEITRYNGFQELYSLQVKVLVALDESEKAEKVATEFDALIGMPQYEMVKALLAHGKLEAAEPHLAKIENRPIRIGLIVQGVVDLVRRDQVGAAKLFERFERDPEVMQVDPHTNTPRHCNPSWLSERALCQAAMGHFDSARATYSKIESACERNDVARKTAEFWQERGKLAVARRFRQEALKAALEIVEDEDGESQGAAISLLIAGAADAGDFDFAWQAYNWLVAQDDLHAPLIPLAKELAAHGRFDEAALCFHRLLNTDRYEAGLPEYVLGLAKGGRVDEALEWARKPTNRYRRLLALSQVACGMSKKKSAAPNP